MSTDLWHHEFVTWCGPAIDHAFCNTAFPLVRGDGSVFIAYSGPEFVHDMAPGTTRIYLRESSDHGRTAAGWGAEREVIHHSECKAFHPSLLRGRDGVLWMFYLGFYESVWSDGEPDMDRCRSDLWMARSTDGGQTWRDRQMIFRGYTGATNGAVETASGHLVVPFSHNVRSPGRLVSACVVSCDRGETWQLGERIDIGQQGDHGGALEPCIIELTDGRLWMLIRTNLGCFYQAFSSDRGLSWQNLGPTNIESGSAPCYVQRLQSGRLALVWNHWPRRTADETHKQVDANQRATLHAAVSEDEGRTWKTPLPCVRGCQLSYPFFCEAEPGQLLVGCWHVQPGWKQATARMFRVSEETLIDAR